MTKKCFFLIWAVLFLCGLGGHSSRASAQGGTVVFNPNAPQPDAQTPLKLLEHDPVQVTQDAIGSMRALPAEPAPTPERQAIDQKLVSLQAKIDSAKTPEDQKLAIKQETEGIADILASPGMQAAPKEYRRLVGNQVANILNHVGSSEKAKRVTDDILAVEPDNRDALNSRAIANYQLGRYPEAIQDATEVSRLEPKSERAFTTRALANYQMRNFASALDDAQMALSLNPNNILAHQIAKLSESRVTKPSALGLDSAQQAIADKIGREYASAQEQRAQAEMVAASMEKPAAGAPPARAAPAARGAPPVPEEKLTDSLNQQALTQVRMNDPRAAIQLASKALERDPENPASHNIMAQAQNMMGLYQGAFEEATQALNHNPDDQHALDERAAAFLGLNRYGEAIADAERAMAVNPKNAEAYLHRAQGREGLGDLKEMLADYKKAAELNPKYQSAYLAAVEKYHLGPAPSPASAPAETPQAQRHAGQRFLIVLICSLTGGFLIAMGLLHIVTGRKAAETAAREKTATQPSFEASYQVLRTIGQGGMGVVFEAVDRALGRKVAIKKMRDEIKCDAAERGRFLQEARIVAALHHPNIVDIHTILENKGDLYLVFEYVKGRTLDEILRKKKRLSLGEAQYITRGVMSALAYAHQQGVVHRDLKPSNIMLTDEGWVKVMDFGIARQAKDTLHRHTSTNVVIGTPLYMAPEQELGEVRPESDLYSFGACLYEMLTGERPFDGKLTTAAKMARHYKKPSSLVGTLPPEVDALIDAALEPDPDKRLRAPADFRARMDAITTRQAPKA